MSPGYLLHIPKIIVTCSFVLKGGHHLQICILMCPLHILIIPYLSPTCPLHVPYMSLHVPYMFHTCPFHVPYIKGTFFLHVPLMSPYVPYMFLTCPLHELLGYRQMLVLEGPSPLKRRV